MMTYRPTIPTGIPTQRIATNLDSTLSALPKVAPKGNMTTCRKLPALVMTIMHGSPLQ